MTPFSSLDTCTHDPTTFKTHFFAFFARVGISSGVLCNHQCGDNYCDSCYRRTHHRGRRLQVCCAIIYKTFLLMPCMTICTPLYTRYTPLYTSIHHMYTIRTPNAPLYTLTASYCLLLRLCILCMQHTYQTWGQAQTDWEEFWDESKNKYVHHIITNMVMKWVV